MKYKYIAGIIRAFLQLTIFFLAIYLVANLSAELFGTKKSFKVKGWGTFGFLERGYSAKINMQVSIPDTITIYVDGKMTSTVMKYYHVDMPDDRKYQKEHITQQTVNQISNFASDPNRLVIGHLNQSGNAEIILESQNKTYRIFWFISDQFSILGYLLTCIILVKLIANYLREDFLIRQSFRLISSLGILLIVIELFELIFSIINSKMVESLVLFPKTLVGVPISNYINLNLSFSNNMSFTKIGMGVLLIILSVVIKEAVTIKQENDLTI